MNHSTCDNLDDYQTGELDDQRRTEFETHLEICPACREEVLAQAELARLLGAASELLEAPRADLTASIRCGVAIAASRRRRWGAVAAMMAAVVVGAATWSLRSAREIRQIARPQQELRIAKPRIAEPRHRGADANDENRQVDAPKSANTVDVAVAAPATTVRIASTSDTIAVPIKSENPNVTILWLYPTVRTAGR